MYLQQRVNKGCRSSPACLKWTATSASEVLLHLKDCCLSGFLAYKTSTRCFGLHWRCCRLSLRPLEHRRYGRGVSRVSPVTAAAAATWSQAAPHPLAAVEGDGTAGKATSRRGLAAAPLCPDCHSACAACRSASAACHSQLLASAALCSGGHRAKAAILLSVFVTALLIIGALSLRDSWGNRLLVPQARCRAPSGLARLHAWGGHGTNHTILSTSLETRLLFNQGLLLAFDFNQEEAQRSFQACLRFAEEAAMCHWGLAYSVGPYLNKVPGRGAEVEGFPSFGPEEFATAHQAADTALQLAQRALQQHGNSSTAWQDAQYCAAMAARFAAGTHVGAAREAAERQYATTMEAIGRSRQDATALALAAEAWLNLVPWDFVAANGTLHPEAATGQQLALQALRWQPHHPLALHLLVHVAEVARPQTAEAAAAAAAAAELSDGDVAEAVGGNLAAVGGVGQQAADALRGLQPRMGHLLHMPSHLYIRVGRYHDAVDVNCEAYQSDLQNSKACLQVYIPEHNLQMLTYAASMAGEYKTLEEYAQKMWDLPDTMPLSAWPGREWTTALLAQVRFGMWDRVLSWPPPQRFERGPGDPGGQEFAQGMWHFGRAMAYASRAQQAQHSGFPKSARDYQQAAQEQEALLEQAAAKAPRDLHTRPGQGVGIYSPGYNDLTAIAAHVLSARLALFSGDYRTAADQLRVAVGIEDGMGYVEPPRQHQPVRQCLGRVLLQAGQLAEAVDVYRADLAAHPENGWALLGLAQALMQQGHSREAAQVKQRFAAAWRHADQPLTSSCPSFG